MTAAADEPAVREPAARGGWRPGYPEYVVVVLLFIFSLQYLDRQVVVILAEPLKLQFGLSDRELGLLSGLAFSVPYGLMVIPAGVLTDRSHRRNCLAAAMFVWSLLTVGTGFARNLFQLIVSRAFIGAAASMSTPISLSLIADYYGKERRASAVGIFYSGPAVATVLGFGLIGLVANTFGWHAAFLAAGLPGLVMTPLLLLTIREPLREGERRARNAAADAAPSLAETFRFVYRQRSLRYMMLAMMLSTVAVSGQIAWMAPFLMRVHHLSLVEAAGTISIAFGLVTTTGQMVGGLLFDRLARHNLAWVGRLSGICVLLALCGMVGCALAPHAWLAIGLLSSWALPIGALYGPVIGTTQTLVAPRMRGVTNSCMGLLVNLIGASVGPLVVGSLSDAFEHMAGDRSVAWALMTTAGIELGAAACFFAAGRWLNHDAAQAEQFAATD